MLGQPGGSPPLLVLVLPPAAATVGQARPQGNPAQEDRRTLQVLRCVPRPAAQSWQQPAAHSCWVRAAAAIHPLPASCGG